MLDDQEVHAFMVTLAAMPLEGELDADGNEIEWENDDAWSTLQSLINDARDLVNGAPDA